MLVKAFKELFIIVAAVVMMWVWLKFSSQDSMQSLGKTLLESAGFQTTNSTLFKTLENVQRNESFGGQANDLLNVTTKIQVPGIVHEPPKGQYELLVTISKCTWSDRLGFHVPIQGSSSSPGQPDGVVQSLLNLALKLRSTVGDFRLKYRPVALRIRKYLPWEQNAPVELGVAWTIAIILYAGICWYERLLHDDDHNLLRNGRKYVQYSVDLLPSTNPAD